jgi:hypothetical protein
MKILRDLVLALLNATILLLVALMLIATLFVSQVNAMREGIVNTVVTRLAQEGESVIRIGDQLEQINTRLQDKDCQNIEALRDEILAMHAKLPDFSRLEEIGTGAIARQIVIAVGEQLSQREVR